MNDITIVTVPRRYKGMSFHDAAQLPEALGRLKSCVETAGFSCFTIDLCIDYFRNTFTKQDVFYEIEKWLIDSMKSPQDCNILSDEAGEHWLNMIENWCDQIAATNPTWLGVSIFADECTKAAYDLCEMMGEKYPDIKIVIGGFAVQNGVGRRDNKGYRTGDLFTDKGLCNAFITGEGDFAIVELLKGNMTFPGINSYQPAQIVDLDDLPFADYSDMVMSNYMLPDPDNFEKPYQAIGVITQSRGCPMPCTFCEVKYYHEKYTWRSPELVAEEIIQHHEKHGITEFFFSDNLLNANPKRLRVLLEKLIEYQKENDVKLEFTSMFIILPEKAFPEDMFRLLAEAGFYSCIYGVETPSQNVRTAMRKMYKDEDLYYTIDMCLKYGIEPGCMIIVGYPAETEEDFEKTLDLLRHYAPTGNTEIDELKRGMFAITPFMIEVYSDVNQKPDEFGISIDRKERHDEWDGLCTYKDAAKRALRGWQVLEELGYDVMNTELNIKNEGAKWERIINE